MGNCLMKKSSVDWGGEDGGSLESGEATRTHGDTQGGSSPGSIRESKSVLSSSLATAAVTEVKIKISKKELKKLLSEADIEGIPAQQVLALLMNAGDHFEAHRRSWKPALQSIPE